MAWASDILKVPQVKKTFTKTQLINTIIEIYKELLKFNNQMNNLLKKMGNRSGHLIEEDIQMANKYMKRLKEKYILS